LDCRLTSSDPKDRKLRITENQKCTKEQENEEIKKETKRLGKRLYKREGGQVVKGDGLGNGTSSTSCT
jgi:hypothetical protein